ncbi:DNA-3-methyladenine glycosylase I [Candidatus Woesearchaeota archaeon]|nr:DNA-3-methyladenine glycosylase I [Candidatus Woesearchaeota archaeon]
MPTKKIYKPKNDSEFLDQLSFIRFVSGFRYSVVEAKWPNIRKAFYNFAVNKVAAADAEKIINAKDMIRNRQKISDIIQNAKLCRDIAKEHGSVIKWIAEVKKQSKKDPLLSASIKEEFRRFHGIGETTSGWLEHLHNAKKDFVTYEVP